MTYVRSILLTLPLALLFIAPSAASAATTSVQTAQLLPLGANTCQPLTVLSATPYMQGNNLESYDLVVADPSYVSVIASAGGTGVPLRYMTRWPQQNGTMKIHIEVPETAVRGTVPVATTLLSSPAGKPTCAATVTFSVTGPVAPSTGHTSGSHTGGSSHVSTGQGSTATGTKAGSTSTASSAASVITPIFAASLSDKLQTLCTSPSAFQLWFVLLTLYIVILALTALARPPLYERAPALPLVAILVPLVLFVGFWYFAPICRVANWIPLVLIAAAIVGLLIAYRDRSAIARVIQLPPAKS